MENRRNPPLQGQPPYDRPQEHQPHRDYEQEMRWKLSRAEEDAERLRSALWQREGQSRHRAQSSPYSRDTRDWRPQAGAGYGRGRPRAREHGPDSRDSQSFPRYPREGHHEGTSLNPLKVTIKCMQGVKTKSSDFMTVMNLIVDLSLSENENFENENSEKNK